MKQRRTLSKQKEFIFQNQTFNIMLSLAVVPGFNCTESAPELELTEQQEEFIKLSNNLSEEQVARILAYAQAIYDLQSGNQHPAVSIPKTGEKNAAEEAEREVDRIVAQELAAAKESKASIK